MTFSLRASEGAPCASTDGASRSSRLRRLTASLGLVSFTTAAFVAISPLAAQAGPHSHHHDDDSRASSRSHSSQSSHAKHHDDSDEPSSHSTKRHAALVRVSTAKLRETPGTTGKTTALLDAGRSAVVIARKEGWVQLKLDSGRKGWVRRDLMDVAKATVHDHDSDSGSHSSHTDRSAQHHDRHDSSTAERSEHSSKHSRRVTEIADATPRHSTDRHADYDDRARHAETVRRQQQHQQAVAAIAAAASAHHSHDASRASHVVHSLVAVATPAPKVIHIAASPEPRIVTSLPDGGGAEYDGEMLADGEAGAVTPARHRHEEVRVASAASHVSSNPRGERVARKALSYRGTPYRMGATGNGAFDCSGFTMYLFGKEGASLPRTAAEQYERGQAIAKDQLQLGDLVFFRNTYKSGISHVGVYIGNNSFVHAAGRSRGVRIDSLSGDFYVNHWAGARRPH